MHEGQVHPSARDYRSCYVPASCYRPYSQGDILEDSGVPEEGPEGWNCSGDGRRRWAGKPDGSTARQAGLQGRALGHQ